MNSGQSDPTPLPEMVISDLETLKVISDDLRLRLIQALRGAPRTVKELASEMGVPQKSLYYHVGLLEDHGLIRSVRTRVVRGITEKWYQATAYLIRLDGAVLSETSPVRDEGLAALVTTALNQTRDDIVTRSQSGLLDPAFDAPRERRLLSTWVLGQLSDERADEFYSRLDALLRDFPVLPPAGNPGPTGHRYRLLMAFYPVDDADAVTDQQMSDSSGFITPALEGET